MVTQGSTGSVVILVVVVVVFVWVSQIVFVEVVFMKGVWLLEVFHIWALQGDWDRGPVSKTHLWARFQQFPFMPELL